MNLKRGLNDLLTMLINAERRIDPLFRNQFNRLLQAPLVATVQALIQLTLKDDHLGLAEERVSNDEGELADQIVAKMSAFTRKQYPDGQALRAGNTKTYGVVRGQFAVLPNLPPGLSQGVFSQTGTFPAWVRFGGPGPLAPPDIKDNGILSMSIKLMDVDGEKLLGDEKRTQDFTGISCPTFTTPNAHENLKLQDHIGQGTPVLYFLNPFDSHYRDAAMQALYARANTSPLEVQYYSCVPYLLGPKQAMKYSMRPCSAELSSIPWNPPADYLRRAMARTLQDRDVMFDFLVQIQTDPCRMPIENAGVRWSEKLSPFVKVATLTFPRQTFESAAQLNFGENLSFNPWHCIADHRPLGNQNRVRRHIYAALSSLRHMMNRAPQIEPTGNEMFDA